MQLNKRFDPMLSELITRGSGICALNLNDIAHLCRVNARAPKGRCNYGIDLWYNQKSSHPKFYIHFFIDNSNANISLYTLSCQNFNLGQLKVCKLMFTLKLLMKK